MSNVTVQVPSNIRIDSIPSTITAGVNFQVAGQVEDGNNASRNLTTAVALKYSGYNSEEKLINGVYSHQRYVQFSSNRWFIMVQREVQEN